MFAVVTPLILSITKMFAMKIRYHYNETVTNLQELSHLMTVLEISELID